MKPTQGSKILIGRQKRSQTPIEGSGFDRQDDGIQNALTNSLHLYFKLASINCKAYLSISLICNTFTPHFKRKKRLRNAVMKFGDSNGPKASAFLQSRAQVPIVSELLSNL